MRSFDALPRRYSGFQLLANLGAPETLEVAIYAIGAQFIPAIFEASRDCWAVDL
jgi:hypothetical protein